MPQKSDMLHPVSPGCSDKPHETGAQTQQATMQKLLLPINKCRVTASYKTPAYRARFGFSHFGIDMCSFAGKTTVYASGNGEVLRTGLDNLLGNTVVVRYENVHNHKTKTIGDVIARYFHMASFGVATGQKINKDTVLGQYGNTGKYSAGAHLHIEFDANIKAPLASKTLGKSSNIITAALDDTMIDPAEILHIKVSAPDNQEIKVDTSVYNGQPYALPELTKLPVVQ